MEIPMKRGLTTRKDKNFQEVVNGINSKINLFFYLFKEFIDGFGLILLLVIFAFTEAVRVYHGLYYLTDQQKISAITSFGLVFFNIYHPIIHAKHQMEERDVKVYTFTIRGFLTKMYYFITGKPELKEVKRKTQSYHILGFLASISTIMFSVSDLIMPVLTKQNSGAWYTSFVHFFLYANIKDFIQVSAGVILGLVAIKGLTSVSSHLATRGNSIIISPEKLLEQQLKKQEESKRSGVFNAISNLSSNGFRVSYLNGKYNLSFKDFSKDYTETRFSGSVKKLFDEKLSKNEITQEIYDNMMLVLNNLEVIRK